MAINKKDIQPMFDDVRIKLTSGLYVIKSVSENTLISITTLDKIKAGDMVNPSIVVALHSYFKNLTKG